MPFRCETIIVVSSLGTRIPIDESETQSNTCSIEWISGRSDTPILSLSDENSFGNASLDLFAEFVGMNGNRNEWIAFEYKCMKLVN